MQIKLEEQLRTVAMLNMLEKATFSRYLGDRYYLQRDDSEPVVLELIEVAGLGASTASQAALRAKREPFSIVFRGPPEACLEQRIYHLEHAQMGSVDLFLVPIGRDEQGFCYEAIFN